MMFAVNMLAAETRTRGSSGFQLFASNPTNYDLKLVWFCICLHKFEFFVDAKSSQHTEFARTRGSQTDQIAVSLR
jgi:hypothetical protein